MAWTGCWNRRYRNSSSVTCLLGFATVVEWRSAVREFFYPLGDESLDFVSTPFVHADESEMSVALLMFLDMVDMSVVVDAEAKSLGMLDDGLYDGSVDLFRCPNRWQKAEGYCVIERFGTPEAVVGKPSLRPVQGEESHRHHMRVSKLHGRGYLLERLSRRNGARSHQILAAPVRRVRGLSERAIEQGMEERARASAARHVHQID